MAMSRSARRLLFFFGAFAIVGVALVVALVVILSGKKVEKQGTVLTIDLKGALTEAPQDELSQLFGGGAGHSLWDLRRGLALAAKDDNIAAVLVNVGPLEASVAQIDELYAAFDTFRATGKPVHALVEYDSLDDMVYATSLVADKVWINAETFNSINGVNANVPFFRGTLEKLHVTPDVIMFEEYKSAGEQFANKEMSPAMRESLSAVVTDISDHLYATEAARRKIDRAVIDGLVAQGMQTASELKAAGLVDELGYRDQVREELRQLTGTEELETVSLKKYLKHNREDAPRGDRIAVVFGEGQIVSTESSSPWGGGGGLLEGPKVARAIREAAEDDDVKAILFRVNSPGGSAVGSDLVWREIERAQEAGKPVVVSMSGVAGSGGYWVSMGADAIVAWPSTITGSIGVVFMKMNLKGLYEWAGAGVESINFSPNADIMSQFRNLDETQRATVMRVMGELYDHFRQKVADGRKLERATVDGLAKGRIWSGTDAAENGLVDKLGGYDVAIGLLREKASLGEDVPLVVYPAPVDPLQQLLQGELEVSAPEAMSLQDLEPVLRELAEPKIALLMPAPALD